MPPPAVTLHLSRNRIAIGDVPTFTVVVRNRGLTPLIVNPKPVTNIEVFTQSGAFVPPVIRALADYPLVPLKRSDFVVLEPGQAQELAVAPEFHSRQDHSALGTYLDREEGVESRFKLPAGDYVLRLTYLAFPDYGNARYDASDVAGAWEGLVEAPPVPLAVLPPSDDAVSEAIEQIDDAGGPLPAIELVRAGRAVRAIDPLLRLFARNRDRRAASAEAVMAIDAHRAAPRLIGAVEALPDRERPQLIATRAFATAVSVVPDCGAIPLIVGAAGGSIANAFDDLFPGIAARCPDLRSRLVALLRAPPASGANGRRDDTASARRDAAEALGRIGNRDDVPILVAVLRRDIPRVPPGTTWYDAPVREGAARALGQIGGPEAAAALLDQLNDQTGDGAVMRVVIEQLGLLQPPGAIDALARLLNVSDESVVTAALASLRQMRGPNPILQLEATLSHPSPAVRAAGLRTLGDLGGTVSPAALRRALNDPDPSVRSASLLHLARHGDTTFLPDFVSRITSAIQVERDASAEGIARFGTRETFVPLRAALETASDLVAPTVARALYQLTFAAIREPRSLTEWDAWWRSHDGRTRQQWAEEALMRGGGTDVRAVRYLGTLRPPPRRVIERMLSDRFWAVRHAAIAAVQSYDRPRAVGLLVRELDSRYVGACRNAVEQLNSLSGEKATFDCMLEADRLRARAHWTPMASRRR